MIRVLVYVGLACLACKLLLGKWPWDFLRQASTRSQAVFRARKLLAVRSNATREEILDAHRRLIAVVHPDRGGTNDQVHEANAARDLLLAEIPDGR